MQSEPSPPTLYLHRMLERYSALHPVAEVVQEAATCICSCARAGGKVLVCGNGGSAADAEHIVGELMKSFVLPRKLTSTEQERFRQAWGESAGNEGELLLNKLQRGVPAIALGAQASLVTAIANDTDSLMIFAQQVYVYGGPNDVLIALSTSGRSANILAALRVARALGMATIGLTGPQPAPMDELCQVLIKVPGGSGAADVQEFHLPIYHTICLMVESELFGDEATPSEASLF